MLTSSQEFTLIKRVQLTNEVPPLSLYKTLHSGLQNDFWGELLGDVNVLYDQEYAYKQINDSVSLKSSFSRKGYGPIPTKDPVTGGEVYPPYHTLSLTGAITPEIDLFLHEVYRYLESLYPDHPDYLELLTPLEINEAFTAAAAILGYVPDYKFLEVWSTSFASMKLSDQKSEEIKWKIRDLRSYAFRRKFAGSYSGYKQIFSSIARHGSVYLTGSYTPKKDNIIDASSPHALRYFRLIDYEGENDTIYYQPSTTDFNGIILPSDLKRIYSSTQHLSYEEDSSEFSKIIPGGFLMESTPGTLYSYTQVDPSLSITRVDRETVTGGDPSAVCSYLEMSNVSKDATQRSYFLPKILPVLNISGGDIPAGAVVRIEAIQPELFSATLADAVSYTLGDRLAVATSTILAGNTGQVFTFGLIENIDTSLFNTNDILYLSVVPGVLFNAPPGDPLLAVPVGTCLFSNATMGKILITTGLSNPISDINIVSLTTVPTALGDFELNSTKYTDPTVTGKLKQNQLLSQCATEYLPPLQITEIPYTAIQVGDYLIDSIDPSAINGGTFAVAQVESTKSANIIIDVKDSYDTLIGGDYLFTEDETLHRPNTILKVMLTPLPSEIELGITQPFVLLQGTLISKYPYLKFVLKSVIPSNAPEEVLNTPELSLGRVDLYGFDTFSLSDFSRLLKGQEVYLYLYRNEENAWKSYSSTSIFGWVDSFLYGSCSTSYYNLENLTLEPFSAETWQPFKDRVATQLTAEKTFIEFIEFYGKVLSTSPQEIEFISDYNTTLNIDDLYVGAIVRGPGIPTGTYIISINEMSIKLSSDVKLFGTFKYTSTIKKQRKDVGIILDFKTESSTKFPTENPSIYNFLYPSQQWPNVSQGYLEGFKDINLFHYITNGTLPDSSVYSLLDLTFTKNLVLELTLDRLLYHTNTLKRKEGSSYVCLNDLSWLDYIDNMINKFKRSTENIFVGSQLSLMTDTSGFFIQTTSQGEWTDPDVHVKFTTFPQNYFETTVVDNIEVPVPEANIPTYVQVGIGGSANSSLFKSLGEYTRPLIYGDAVTFDSDRVFPLGVTPIQNLDKSYTGQYEYDTSIGVTDAQTAIEYTKSSGTLLESDALLFPTEKTRTTYHSPASVGLDADPFKITSTQDSRSGLALELPVFETPVGAWENPHNVRELSTSENKYQIINTSIYPQTFSEVKPLEESGITLNSPAITKMKRLPDRGLYEEAAAIDPITYPLPAPDLASGYVRYLGFWTPKAYIDQPGVPEYPPEYREVNGTQVALELGDYYIVSESTRVGAIYFFADDWLMWVDPTGTNNPDLATWVPRMWLFQKMYELNPLSEDRDWPVLFDPIARPTPPFSDFNYSYQTGAYNSLVDLISVGFPYFIVTFSEALPEGTEYTTLTSNGIIYPVKEGDWLILLSVDLTDPLNPVPIWYVSSGEIYHNLIVDVEQRRRVRNWYYRGEWNPAGAWLTPPTTDLTYLNYYVIGTDGTIPAATVYSIDSQSTTPVILPIQAKAGDWLVYKGTNPIGAQLVDYSITSPATAVDVLTIDTVSITVTPALSTAELALAIVAAFSAAEENIDPPPLGVSWSGPPTWIALPGTYRGLPSTSVLFIAKLPAPRTLSHSVGTTGIVVNVTPSVYSEIWKYKATTNTILSNFIYPQDVSLWRYQGSWTQTSIPGYPEYNGFGLLPTITNFPGNTLYEKITYVREALKSSWLYFIVDNTLFSTTPVVLLDPSEIDPVNPSNSLSGSQVVFHGSWLVVTGINASTGRLTWKVGQPYDALPLPSSTEILYKISDVDYLAFTTIIKAKIQSHETEHVLPRRYLTPGSTEFIFKIDPKLTFNDSSIPGNDPEPQTALTSKAIYPNSAEEKLYVGDWATDTEATALNIVEPVYFKNLCPSTGIIYATNPKEIQAAPGLDFNSSYISIGDESISIEPVRIRNVYNSNYEMKYFTHYTSIPAQVDPDDPTRTKIIPINTSIASENARLLADFKALTQNLTATDPIISANIATIRPYSAAMENKYYKNLAAAVVSINKNSETVLRPSGTNGDDVEAFVALYKKLSVGDTLKEVYLLSGFTSSSSLDVFPVGETITALKVETLEVESVPTTYWVIGSSAGSVKISTDAGTSWTSASLPDIGVSQINVIKYAAGLWFIACNNGKLYRSSNLTSWDTVVQVGTAFTQAYDILALEYDATTQTWAVGGENGILLYSTDVANYYNTWNVSTLPAATDENNVGWADDPVRSIKCDSAGVWMVGGGFDISTVDVDEQGTTTVEVDGGSLLVVGSIVDSDWRFVTLPDIWKGGVKYEYEGVEYQQSYYVVNSVGYSNGAWIVAGTGGRLSLSSDTITWINPTLPLYWSTSDIEKVDNINGTWFIYGADGKIANSYDGITWSSLPAATTPLGAITINGIAFGNNKYLIGGAASNLIVFENFKQAIPRATILGLSGATQPLGIQIDTNIIPVEEWPLNTTSLQVLITFDTKKSIDNELLGIPLSKLERYLNSSGQLYLSTCYLVSSYQQANRIYLPRKDPTFVSLVPIGGYPTYEEKPELYVSSNETFINNNGDYIYLCSADGSYVSETYDAFTITDFYLVATPSALGEVPLYEKLDPRQRNKEPLYKLYSDWLSADTGGLIEKQEFTLPLNPASLPIVIEIDSSDTPYFRIDQAIPSDIEGVPIGNYFWIKLFTKAYSTEMDMSQVVYSYLGEPGIVSDISGTGPWTATLTLTSTTTVGLKVGTAILGFLPDTGALYSAVPDSIVITSIVDSTKLTFTVVGGATPIAGTVTNAILRGGVVQQGFGMTATIDVNTKEILLNKMVVPESTTAFYFAASEVTGIYFDSKGYGALYDKETSYEQFELEILTGCSLNGDISLVLPNSTTADIVSFTVSTEENLMDTPEEVAAALKSSLDLTATEWEIDTITSTATTIVFVRTVSGFSALHPIFNGGSTGVTATVGAYEFTDMPWEISPEDFEAPTIENTLYTSGLKNILGQQIYMTDKNGNYLTTTTTPLPVPVPIQAPEFLAWNLLLATKQYTIPGTSVTYATRPKVHLPKTGSVLFDRDLTTFETGQTYKVVKLRLLTSLARKAVDTLNDPTLIYQIGSAERKKFGGADRLYIYNSDYPSYFVAPDLYKSTYFTNDSKEYVYLCNELGQYIKYTLPTDMTNPLEAANALLSSLEVTTVEFTPFYQPKYETCFDWYMKDFYVEGVPNENPFWQYLVIKDTLDATHKEWTQSVKIMRKKKLTSTAYTFVEVPELERYFNLGQGMEYTEKEPGVFSVTPASFIQHTKGKISAIYTSNLAFDQSFNPYLDLLLSQYGIRITSHFEDDPTINIFDPINVITDPDRFLLDLTASYTVNSLQNFANLMDKQSSIVGVSELGVFNKYNKMIAYATFPPIIYDSSKHHVSFNIFIRQVPIIHDPLLAGQPD